MSPAKARAVKAVMGRVAVAARGRGVLPAAMSARPAPGLPAVVLLTGGLPGRVPRAPRTPAPLVNRVHRVKDRLVKGHRANRDRRVREAGPGINDPGRVAIDLCGLSVLVVWMTAGPARSEMDGVVAVGGVTAVMAARRVTVIRKKVVVPASRCRLRGHPRSRRPSRWAPFRKPLRRLASRRVFSVAFATWGTARRLLFRKKAFLWRSKGVT